MQKDSEKEYIYMYIYETLVVHLKLTQYCKSTILQLTNNNQEIYSRC